MDGDRTTGEKPKRPTRPPFMNKGDPETPMENDPNLTCVS
jgi:hypothetical protein